MSRHNYKLAGLVFKELLEVYSDIKCALNYKSAWQLLVATILSAQCTDIRVNKVTVKLFDEMPDVEDYANASVLKLEKLIHSTGFYRNKAKNIIACAKEIVKLEMFPEKMEDLVKLPGVGRKTAGVVLSTYFGVNEGVVVDTHVSRLAQRIGLTKESKPDKIEQELMKLYKVKDWDKISLLLIYHGRNRCYARKPDCTNCEILEICLRRI